MSVLFLIFFKICLLYYFEFQIYICSILVLFQDMSALFQNMSALFQNMSALYFENPFLNKYRGICDYKIDFIVYLLINLKNIEPINVFLYLQTTFI